MSETPELPPLPHPFHTYAMPWIGRGEPGPREPFDYFTPEKVSAYGRECWEAGRRAGLEEAAKLCEEVPANGNLGSERNWHQQGRQDCAAAIRAKAKP